MHMCVYLKSGIFYCILFPHISDQASLIYEETVRQDRLVINFEVPNDPLSLVSYIEDCRMKLWDNAFPSFRGQEAFNKTHEFEGFNGTELIVRRVLFR
jgi:hypothetical protein